MLLLKSVVALLLLQQLKNINAKIVSRLILPTSLVDLVMRATINRGPLLMKGESPVYLEAKLPSKDEQR